MNQSDREVPQLKQRKGSGGKKYRGLSGTSFVTLHVLPTVVSTANAHVLVFVVFAIAS